MDMNNKTPNLQMCGYDSNLEMLKNKSKKRVFNLNLYFLLFCYRIRLNPGKRMTITNVSQRESPAWRPVSID